MNYNLKKRFLKTIFSIGTILLVFIAFVPSIIHAAQIHKSEQNTARKIMEAGNAYRLIMTAEKPSIPADGSSSTVLSAKVTDKSGKPLTEEDVEIIFSSTRGTLGSERVACQNGVAKTTLRSVKIDSSCQAAVSATIIESRTNPDLIGIKSIINILMYANNGSGHAQTGNANNKTAQKIICSPTAIKKGNVTYGSTFYLKAKTSGNGKLSYQSGNSRILSVNAQGKVSVKNYGTATITIKASASQKYKAVSKKITVTVIPKKVKITTALWKKGNKAYFQWKADSSADGYQYSFAYNPQFSPDVKGEPVGKKNSLTMSNFNTDQDGIYIRIRAYKKIGKKTTYGEWSDFRYLAL